MAHNIATINGTDATAYLRETPWHGLGVKLSERASIDEAFRLAQLDFQVETEPVQLADGTVIGSHKATIRVDRDGSRHPLSIVGEDYEVTQGRENASILEPIIDVFGGQVAALGALDEGRKGWTLVKLKDATITPVPGDDVRGYALLHWSHDGQTAVTLVGTGVRVVCQNTLSLAVGQARGKAWIRIRHTASAQQRLDEAAVIVKRIVESLHKTGETFASLAAKRLGPLQLQAYLDKVLPAEGGKVSKVLEARRETVKALAHDGVGADLANQLVNAKAGEVSLWAAYNAVTEYYDHVRTAEAQSASGLLRAQTSAIFGGNAEIKAQALVVAQQLLGGAAQAAA